MDITDRNGLSAAVAAQHLKRDGFNELPSHGRRSLPRIALEILRQPMFALLVGGGVVYLLLGDRLEALLLLAFACLSVIITIVQESRSERVLEALRNLASPRALVVRDGQRILIPGREVVVDDLIVLAEGDRVAADARLLVTHDLLLDESLLTGESMPVGKRSESPSSAGPVGEGSPLVYAGTLVARGSGLALVLATGARTEMGKIGRALGSIEVEQPHLQQQLRWLVRDFAIVGAVAGTLAVLLYGLQRGSWLQALLGGIALGMSLLPEEFPLVMTVFMAMGAWRISRARVLTRRASAIETLGSTTVLCTDKTGTLTENRMTVAALVGEHGRWDPSAKHECSQEILEALQAARLACPAHPTDPMDVAIADLVGPSATGMPIRPDEAALLRAYGLRPELFATTNIWEDATGLQVAYAKGAVEAIATLCHLSIDRLRTIKQQANALAQAGMRVLAIARTAPMAALTAGFPDSPRSFNFSFLGLIGFADPLRANVPAAVAECRSAGVRVLMMTGDYPETARAIAKQAGLNADRIVTGDEIEALADPDLTLTVHSASIFARIRPDQKLRIVECLKASGEVVAMTGDGVNDAPALKSAHIGVAMGSRGTEVAREASSIVLLDDEFSSIVTTIRLGRRIYDNLRKAVEYIIAVHIPIAGLALLPLLLGLPLILGPLHIAFLEMIIDPACSMVFEAEEEERDVMRRPPRKPTTPLLLRRRMIWALIQGVFALLVIGGLLVTAAHFGMPEADLRTLVFTSLVLVNMSLILVNRSFGASLIDAVLRPNRSLWILLGGVVVLLAIVILWPPTRSLFNFGSLHWGDLGICAIAGIVSLLTLEKVKSRWFRTIAAAPA